MPDGLGRYLLRTFLAPAADYLLHRGALAARAELQRLEWLEPHEVAAHQWRKLVDLVAFAARTVPCYRDLLAEAGVKAGSLTPESYAALPPLTRADLRANYPQRLLSEEAPPGCIEPAVTSGTTAYPVKFALDARAQPGARGIFRFFNGWVGVVPGDRVLHFGHTLSRAGLVQRVGDWFSGTRLMALEPILAKDGLEVARLLDLWQPDCLMGHPSTLRLAAHALRLAETRLRFRPKAVIVHSEACDAPTRRLLTEVFGAPVHSRYGAKEFSTWVGQTCPDGGSDDGAWAYHLNPFRFYVEIVDPTGRPVPPGEEGRIVITDLGNRVMPLLRYAVGDIGRLASAPCSCGRGWPVLAELIGRTVDYLIFPSGRMLSDHYLNRVFRTQLDLILEHQLEQTAVDELILRVVPCAPGYGSTQAEALSREMSEFIGEPVSVSVDVVDHIPREPSGKLRILKPLPGLDGSI